MKLQQDVKTFADLEFHSYLYQGLGVNAIAKCEFANGYGLSIVTGPNAYCTKDTYEVAILYDGEITYATPLTDDVLTCQTKEDINKLIEIVRQYK